MATSSEDLECEIEMVPDLLYNMMAWILSTKSEDSVERVSDISPEVHRLALSLSQDLIHSATRGPIKTPKTCPYNDCKEPDGEC